MYVYEHTFMVIVYNIIKKHVWFYLRITANYTVWTNASNSNKSI